MRVVLTTDWPTFSHEKLVGETWYKKLVYKLHTGTQVNATIQVSCTRNVEDDGDDDLAVAAIIVLSTINDTDL